MRSFYNAVVSVALLTATSLPLVAAPAAATANDTLGFTERFALAADRAAALTELIPGTEDYYYYHCLQYQNSGQLDKVPPLMADWHKQFENQTARYQVINRRQHLLEFATKPTETIQWLRSYLGLNYNYSRDADPGVVTHPAALDSNTISYNAFLNRTPRGVRSFVSYFTPLGLEKLVAMKLTPEQRRELLNKLTRADIPGLMELITAELNANDSPGFARIAVCKYLTLDQLEALRGTIPDLAADDTWVTAMASRLAATPDADPTTDPDAADAALARLLAFAKTLPPSQNSFKAAIYYRALEVSLAHGQLNQPLLLEYLQLPRRQHYVPANWIREQQNRGIQLVDLNRSYSSATRIPPIGNDEPLIRACLEQALVNAADTAAFAQFVEKGYLSRLFAETKLLHGIGNANQWAGNLTPEQLQVLRDRIEVNFTRDNPRRFAANDNVALKVSLKNCGALTLRVYDIDAATWYRQNHSPITTAIGLDGLVANFEKSYDFTTTPPLRRHIETFTLDACKQPGTYLIECVGNGISARALVTKGHLRLVESVTPGGHLFTILDPDGTPRPDATLTFGERAYSADADATVLIPFSTESPDGPIAPFGTISTPSAVEKPLVIEAGGIATLTHFNHRTESYTLTLDPWLDAEQIIAGHSATALLRPRLMVSGVETSLSLLEQPLLELTTTDCDGVDAVSRTQLQPLKDDAELTHTFTVPPRTQSFRFTLSGRVRNLSLNKDDKLTATGYVKANGLLNARAPLLDADGLLVTSLHLRRSDAGWIVDTLGRNGEPTVAEAVNFKVKHASFTQLHDFTLQSDPNGRIFLGPLTDIVTLEASINNNLRYSWQLRGHTQEYGMALPESITLGANEPLTLPGPANPPANPRDAISLLSLANHATDLPLRDVIDLVRFSPNTITVGPLPAGDYRLTLKHHLGEAEARAIALTVTAGPTAAGHRLTPTTTEPLRPTTPLQITTAAVAGNTLRLTMRGTTATTRVHILGRRFNDSTAIPFNNATFFPAADNPFAIATPIAVYTPGRFIGDEARYVFDRRHAGRFTGNMLERPSLFIAPWSPGETKTRTLTARREEPVPAMAPPSAKMPDVARSRKLERLLSTGRGAGYATPAYDFLPRQSSLIANLRPADNGTLEVPLKNLANFAEVTVVALDNTGHAWSIVPLAENKLEPRDLRLAATLDLQQNLTERKTVHPANNGETITLDAASGGDFRIYDTQAQAFRLFQSLDENKEFDSFAFITDWPKLDTATKLQHYHDFACHGLNLFLYRKDRPFFDAVIKPLLTVKRDKTFIDNWLLGDDLSRYAVWPELKRLNTAERVLLAQRLPALRQPLVTALEQAVEIDPIPAEVFDYLFAAAIGSGALEDSAPAEMAFAMEQEFFETGERMARGVGGQIVKEAEAFDSVMQVKSPVVMKGIYGARSAEAVRQRAQAEQLYRAPDKTREWVETHYYKTPRAKMVEDFIEPGPFWLDAARHASASDKPFLSPWFATAINTTSERLLALALLDLPFTAAEHKIVSDSSNTVTPASPLILFTRQISTAPTATADTAPLMVVQTAFDPADRYRYTDDNDKVLKPVTAEFLSGRPYGVRIVATNPGDQPRRAALLIQIPQGAIALNGKRSAWSEPLTLEPYSSRVVEYYFYFPFPGDFSQYPPSLSAADAVINRAAPQSFHVVPRATIFDTESWDYISQKGTPDQVLHYLRERNIRRPEVKLPRICWRLFTGTLYNQVIATLEERQIFDPYVWQFALLHNDAPRVATWLRLSPNDFISNLGPWLDSGLIKIDAEQLDLFEHKEYWPLVNARVHSLGDKRDIANESLKTQYLAFVNYLGHKPTLDARDRLTLVVYLLMQDRTAEAIAWFATVKPTDSQMAMQADYTAAYLAFSQNKPDEAAAIARRYDNLQQKRWRDRFRDIIAQAAEAAGQATTTVDPDSHDQTQHALADKAPSLTLTVDGRAISATARNITSGELRLYPLDIELLFSRQPFLADSATQSAAIRPAHSAPLKFTAADQPLAITLPPEFARQNLLIEVRAGGLSERRSYTPNTLRVQTVASHGRVRVQSADGQTVAGAYVKVYARHADGSERFYKDGYTDPRGWFDYASLSTADLDTARRFAILIIDDTRGAALLEAPPPTR